MAALLLVVMGHLTLAVVDVAPDGDVRTANLLALRPGWAWVAAAAPMPVFFAAAGWANATSTLTDGARRLRALVGIAAVVVAAWSALVLVATVVAGEPGIVADGARVATQPLWFLAAYLPFAAAGQWLAAAADRHPVIAIGGALAGLAALDLARFAGDAPDWIGWPGFALAWGIPLLLGGWWRARRDRGTIDERRTGIVLAAGGVLAATALVHLAGYQPSLIDTSEVSRSNTTPPTLYTAVAGVAQVGVLIAAATVLDGAATRLRRVIDRAGEVAIGVYVWHLSALALCVAVVAAGVPVPDRLTGWWWATRPVWWAAVLAVTGALVAATAAVRARRRAADDGGDVAPRAAAAGVATAAAGAAFVGLEGPRSAAKALLSVALFSLGWWLLRAPAPSTGRGGHMPTG
jgi:hypothetical protein